MFWQRAATSRPREMPDQYARRIEAAKAESGWMRPTMLIDFERRVREFVEDWEKRAGRQG